MIEPSNNDSTVISVVESAEILGVEPNHTPIEEPSHDNSAETSPTFSISYFMDILTVPRFIILPFWLLNYLGGPFFIITPWTLWGMLLYFSLFLFLFRPKNDTQSLVNIFSQSTNHSSTTDAHSPSDLRVFASQSQLTIGLLTFVYIFDVLFSFCSITISIGLILIVFIRADGMVDPGWIEGFSLMVLETVFCCLSLIGRVCGFIGMCYQKCPSTCHRLSPCASQQPSSDPPPPSPLIPSPSPSKSFLQRIPVFLSFLSLALAGFIANSLALHKYLSLSSPSTQSQASYEGCDPLVSKACSLPFPSSFYLAPDPSTPTGYRVNLPPFSLPFTKSGSHLSPSLLNQFDGFSLSGQILWALDLKEGQYVQESQLVSFQNLDKSLLTNSTSLLVNLPSLTLHRHFSEADHLDPDPSRMLYSLPSQALLPNSTYLVIVQRLTSPEGLLLPPSSLFAQYRSRYLLGEPPSLSDPRYSRYATSLFPAMQALNLSLEEVQLAFDFHTASEESLLGPLQSLHNSTLERVDRQARADPSSLYRRTKLTTFDCSNPSQPLASQALYRVSVPWYLHSLLRQRNPLVPSLMGLSGVDVDRIPLSGEALMLIQVPCSLSQASSSPSGLLEFGHGIFGDAAEAGDQIYLHYDSDDNNWIVWAMDWRGFSTPDIVLAARTLMSGGTESVRDLYSATIQSFASKLAGREIVRVILSDNTQRRGLQLPPLPSLSPSSRRLQMSEPSLPSRYMGDSFGSILGAGYAAYTRYARAVLLVAGSPFTFVMGRSDLFRIFALLMDLQFFTRTDLRIALASWQLLFDGAESSGWASTGRFLNETAVLTQIAMGDSTVSTIAGRILAANVQSQVLAPALFPIAGMGVMPSPSTIDKTQDPDPILPAPQTLTPAPHSTAPHSQSQPLPPVSLLSIPPLPPSRPLFRFLRSLLRSESSPPRAKPHALRTYAPPLASHSPPTVSHPSSSSSRTLLSISSSPFNPLSLSSYPGDAALIPPSSEIPPVSTNVHYCLPHNIYIRYQNTLFLSSPSTNASLPPFPSQPPPPLAYSPCAPFPCIFQNHAHC